MRFDEYKDKLRAKGAKLPIYRIGGFPFYDHSDFASPDQSITEYRRQRPPADARQYVRCQACESEDLQPYYENNPFLNVCQHCKSDLTTDAPTVPNPSSPALG